MVSANDFASKVSTYRSQAKAVIADIRTTLNSAITSKSLNASDTRKYTRLYKRLLKRVDRRLSYEDSKLIKNRLLVAKYIAVGIKRYM
jgi:hypothetical protein